MALLRKLFARKAMDGLSHISERVFVFNSCLSTETPDEDAHKDYLTSVIIQLKSSHPHTSLMVFNFTATDRRAAAIDCLPQYGVSITDYPCRYADCPSLPLATIRVFLSSCVDWLVSDRQRNILLMHCENGAWPALAFAVSSLLVYIEESASEQTMLEMVYRRAPMELLSADSSLNPQPSHLRYLQYVTRLRGSLKGMRQEPFILDCLILRVVPNFDGNGGCRPIIRVHGQEPHAQIDTSPAPKVLFRTPRIKQQFKQYKQEESAVIKVNIECQIQGDVVIECIHVGDKDHEQIMFRIMFNTCFLQSNMMVFTLDDIDLPWTRNRDKFQEDFKIEVFFSEVELSDMDSLTAETLGESQDESELSSAGNAEEFYDFDEILIDSDLNSKHSETLRQDSSHQEPDVDTEESETKASDTASGSSEDKGSISTDNEAEFIHEADLTRESKDPSLEKISNLLEVGSSSAMQPVVPTRKDLNEEMSTNCQENRSVPEIVVHQGAETILQEGGQGFTSSVNEVNHNNVAGYEALNPLPMRKTWQCLKKQAAIIPPVPIIKKKMRKTDSGSDDKPPSKGKMLLGETMQKRTLLATSSSKHSTSQTKTSPTPHKEHEIANKLKQEAAQARRTSTLSKEHSKHSSHQATRDPMAEKDCANDITTERKQATFTIQTPPSSPRSPPSQELNQEDSKGSRNPLETTKKSTTHSSVKPRTGRTPRQEATMTSVVEAPRRTIVLKKSLSSPAISQSPTTTSEKRSTMTSLPGVKTTYPSSALSMAASSSPQARKHSVPSSPRRSPLFSSKVDRAVPTAQPDTQQGTSAPVRLPRRASFSELSHSLTSIRVSNVRSLSPRASRIMQNHPVGVRDSGRSLSPLSPKLSRAQPSPRTTAVTTSDSKDNNRSMTLSATTRPRGCRAAPARPTRLSS